MLLQVYLHAAIAAEAGVRLEDVAAGSARICPQPARVRPREPETDPARVNERWEEAKAAEKEREDLLEASRRTPGAESRRQGARATPACRQPVRLDPGTTDLGERLLLLVEEARAGGIDPEQALREAVRRAAG